MKLKLIASLFLFLFVFTIAGYSQVEDEEVQMFSFGTRSLSAQAHDFGVIKDVKAEYRITIKNPGKSVLKIGEIFIPKGVGVTVLDRSIKPGEKGVIVVTIDPKYMKSGQFQRKVIITTHTMNQSGTKVSKTKAFGFKGQVL
ncbi:MAG: hypothetical protein B6I20_11080 [Bacteroidetes bacterium 4572_117]|nr:MAG: hypothetical protein B6I20_11080 [Bacteroidetes bacterium 4572_117]